MGLTVYIPSRELRILTVPTPIIRLPLVISFAFFFAAQSLCQTLTILQNGKPTPVGTNIGYLSDTPTRQKIDLSGTWSYTLDDEHWHDVQVPSAIDEEARVTFLRKFTVTEPLVTSSAFKLVALGINYEAEVYINDIFIGKHTGGYTSFDLSIPEDVIQPGSENAIKIVVSNILSAKTTLPLRKQIWGWRNYGGILRDIYLLVTPRLWTESLALKSTLDPDLKRGTVEVSATISNQSFPDLMEADSLKSGAASLYQLQFDLVDAATGSVVTQTSPYTLALDNGKDADVSLSFPVYSPRLWSPENPNLYRLQAVITGGDARKRVAIDEYDTDFGFTSVAMKQSLLVVNGKPVELNGVVWVEDSPDHGSSLTYDEMEKDVALIKLLGANAIRFAFHPPHPYMINLCNRYGLFALEEIPAWNAPGEILGGELFQTLAETMLRETLERDRNHPSVLAWGIGDAFDSIDPRSRPYIQRMVALVKSMDARPVYYGSIFSGADAGSDLADLAAVDLQESDMKDFREALAAWKKSHPGKPVLVLSYGKTVQSKNHNGYSDPLSEEAQARFLMQSYAAIRESGAIGGFVQSFADWKGDRPIMTVEPVHPYLLPVGLVARDREKRLAYEVVRTVFAGQKVTALPIGKYRTAFPVVHILAGFLIIFVVAYQYHYNRRFNESMKRALLRSYNFFADLRDVRTVSVFHTLLLTVIISLTLATVLSSLLFHFRTNRLADIVITQVVVSDAAKEYLIKATWNPLEGILALTGLFLLLSVVCSTLVRLSSLFVKSKIHWMHAHTVLVWASVPLVFLSPLGMSLFKILQTPFYVLPSLIILLIFALWVIARTLKGISVILDLNPVRTSIGGILLMVAAVVLILFYYDSEYSLTAYFQFLSNIVRGHG